MICSAPPSVAPCHRQTSEFVTERGRDFVGERGREFVTERGCERPSSDPEIRSVGASRCGTATETATTVEPTALPVAVETVSMETASLETVSIETVSLDSTGSTAIGLAGSPTTVVAVWLIWSACGLLLAQVMARRGHDRRLMGALGCALGPFMLYIYFHPTRHREPAPLVLDAGLSQPGVRVMVGVGASPTAVADVLPLIDLLPEHVGHVDLVARIDIELTEGPWTESTEATADTLRGASVFLADRHPGLVLVPGSPGSALGEFAITGDYDVVLMAGSTRELDALGRVLDREGIAPLLLARRRAGM